MWNYWEEISDFYKSVLCLGCGFGFVVWFFLMTVQIAIAFGAKVLEHVLSLCWGNYDFLEQLPVP